VIRIERNILIDRPARDVFALVSEPGRYPEFFAGITKWESRSQRKRGIGARFRVLMKVGSIEAGGTINVTNWEDDRVISWSSDQGIRHKGQWTLEPRGAATELTLLMEYELAGGPVGWLVERLAGRIVGRNLTATLLGARRLLEHEDAT
jgi:ribosome-associated toxin RatA of RatAB toxin-antitoxin module